MKIQSLISLWINYYSNLFFFPFMDWLTSWYKMRSIPLTLGKKVVKWSKLQEKRDITETALVLERGKGAWPSKKPDHKAGKVNYVIPLVTCCKPVTPPRANSSSSSANCTQHSFGSILSFPTLEDAMSSIVPDGDKIRDAHCRILFFVQGQF